MIHHGDCLDVMASLDPESVSAIVTDPPYGLAFMGKAWDHGVPGIPFWAEMYRAAKPGAHLLAFGGTRTVHRMTCAIEDAGWEIRDCLVWGYASGFPKSHNLTGDREGWGTALKPAWEPIVMARKPLRGTVAANVQAHGTGALNIDGARVPFSPTADRATSQDAFGSSSVGSTGRIDPWLVDESRVHNPSTALRAWSAARRAPDSARLASALADAFVGRGVLGSQGGYPFCRGCDDGLARIAEAADRDDAPLRPDVPGAPPLREWSASRIRESRCADHLSTWDELVQVVAEADVSAYGNDTKDDVQRLGYAYPNGPKGNADPTSIALGRRTEPVESSPLGRWPANVILTDAIFDGGIEGVVGGGDTGPAGTAVRHNGGGGDFFGGISPKFRPDIPWEDMGYGDSGTYSRFFLIPKSARSEREPMPGMLPPSVAFTHNSDGRDMTNPRNGHGGGERARIERGETAYRPRANSHPTVKPLDLMRHLVRLVTPPGGIVLDPFLGSGTTGIACEMEGFDWIGIEREAEYVAIAEARLEGVQKGMGLSA